LFYSLFCFILLLYFFILFILFYVYFILFVRLKIKKVIEKVKIEVMVMIRPRGGDFLYSENEFEIMKEDIKMCKQLHVAGIVIGMKNFFSLASDLFICLFF
jgi:hypothetical protein